MNSSLDIIDEQGKSNKKIYFVSTSFRANWMNAQSFCKSYGMDLASIESEEEAKYFLKSCENKNTAFEEHSQIGGVLMHDHWFWITSHQKVNFKLTFKGNKNSKNDGECLQLVKGTNLIFGFGRTNCFSNNDAKKFVCQKMIKQKDIWSSFFER